MERHNRKILLTKIKFLYTTLFALLFDYKVTWNSRVFNFRYNKFREVSLKTNSKDIWTWVWLQFPIEYKCDNLKSINLPDYQYYQLQTKRMKSDIITSLQCYKKFNYIKTMLTKKTLEDTKINNMQWKVSTKKLLTLVLKI